VTQAGPITYLYTGNAAKAERVSEHLFHSEERRMRMGLDTLLNEVENLKVEYEKFDRGNKSAGTRARKCLQNIKKIAQEVRTEIQERKND
jgi:hydrogenase maturation factor